MTDTWFLLFYMIYLSVYAVFILVGYVLYGIGLYGMARNAGIGNEWLAFIPFARKYLQGKLGGPITIHGKTIKQPGLWLLLLPFFVGMASGFLVGIVVVLLAAGIVIGTNAILMIPVSGVAFLAGVIILLLILAGAAAKSGLRALINYQILSRYCQGNVLVLHIIFSVILPMYEAVIFFYYRHKPFICDLHKEL